MRKELRDVLQGAGQLFGLAQPTKRQITQRATVQQRNIHLAAAQSISSDLDKLAKDIRKAKQGTNAPPPKKVGGIQFSVPARQKEKIPERERELVNA